MFKLIGTLGAVDPYLINQILFFHKQKNDNSEDDEMLNNLPQMLGIEPSMILLNHGDGESTEDRMSKASGSSIKEMGARDQISGKQALLSRSGVFGGQGGTGVEIDGRGFLGLGQPDRQREVQIVLDINRPLNDEYAVGIGLQNNLENTLKKYDIKKPEITKENKFSMIAMEHLIKILND